VGGEPQAAGTRIEIFGVLAARFGLIAGAINDLDGANDEDLPGVAGFEECIALAERDFRLSTSTTPSSGSRFGSTIDRRNFCVSSHAVL
jgi:hypothetical protein